MCKKIKKFWGRGWSPRAIVRGGGLCVTLYFLKKKEHSFRIIAKQLALLGGRILLLGGLVLAGVFVLDHTRHPADVVELFSLKQIHYQGLSQLDREALDSLIFQSVSEDLLLIDLDRVRALVESESWVKEATVRRKLPDGLFIHITERQAVAIRGALMKLLPNSHHSIMDNFVALQKDLQALDTELRGIAVKFGEAPLVGSHPVYQYLARGYDLKIRSVHWEPDGMPDEDGWAELAAIRREHPAKIMLWEGEPDKAIARKLMEQGVSSVVFDPCGNRPDEGDWLSVIQANISRLGRATPEN